MLWHQRGEKEGTPSWENTYQIPPSKPNLTLEEQRAIKELKEDYSQVALTADKGVAMVVMDRKDYTYKALSLLQILIATRPSLRTLPPNSKIIFPQTLRDIKNQGGLSDHSYRKCTPPVQLLQNFIAFPKYTMVAPP